MKKIIFICLLSIISIVQGFGQIWVNPITLARPISSHYLGDKLASPYYFQYEIGQTSWNASEVGIGQNPDGSTGWNWAAAAFYENGSGDNRKVQRDIGNFQFTSTGTWYAVGRAKANSGDAWTYADEGTWSNNTSLLASTTSGNCPYFTVSALEDPTSPSATAVNSTQINLSWTKWNSKNVMIVRKLTSAAASDPPLNGTSYAVNATLGTGTVVYNSNGTSFNDQNLTPGTGYSYLFYSENYNYYSTGSSASATTASSTVATDYFRTKATGNWSNVGTWESSSNNSLWIDATLAPGATSNTTTILNGHTVTLTGATDVKSLTINAGGTLSCGANTLTIATAGILANSGTFTAGTGTVSFAGTGTVSGTVGFNNVTLAGSVNFGSASTINGTLTVNSNGAANTNGPYYATGSNLVFATGGPYDISNGTAIWIPGATLGKGVPANVTVSTTNPLNIFQARDVTGILTINSGVSVVQGNNAFIVQGNMDNSGSYSFVNDGANKLVVKGNFINQTGATTSLSAAIGGDLQLQGNLIDNGTFNANGRAIFLIGGNIQEISGSGTFDISYVRINKNGGSVKLLSNLVCAGPNGGNAMEIDGVSSILDLNGHNLIIGQAGVSSTYNVGIAIPGVIRGVSTSSISILGSGNLGTIKFDQTTPGTTNVLKNLAIDRTSSGSVTLGNSLTVNESLTTTGSTALTIAASSVLTIGANCQATLLGSVTNNATETGLVVKSGGSLIQSSAGVPATVERDIAAWGTALHGWHFLSAPVVNQAIDPAFTNGTPTNYDFYSWWEPTNIWVNFKNTTVYPTWNDANGGTNFIPGKGYLVEYAATSTKQFTGTLNTTNITVNGLTLTGGIYGGWNLVGNPFTSAIKWNDGSAWTVPVNFAGTAKIWNESGAAYTDISPNGYIPALNGFMVQVLSGSPASLTIPAAARVHNAASWYKSTENPSILLVANDPTGETAQESIIRFDNAATTGFDPASDSRFLAGYAPRFYSMAGNEQLSTNTLPQSGGNVQIPFTFVKNDGASFTIEAKKITDINGPVILKDLKTNATQDLTVKSVYSFTSSSSDDPNRFLLSFSHVGIGENTNTQPISVYSAGNTVYVSNKTGSPDGDVYVYNMMGQLIMQQKLTSDLMPISLKAGTGYYLVKVISGNQVFSGKVFINQ